MIIFINEPLLKLIMAGKMLVDVLTLKKDGLVGFTEEGEQVPLNLPILFTTLLEWDKEKLVKLLSDEAYVYFPDAIKRDIYNRIYTRRI